MRIGADPFVDIASRAQAIQSRLINPISENENNGQTPFSEILQITFTGATEASSGLSAASRVETAKLLVGEEDNLIDNMIAGEKSGIQFELNLAIRTKVLDAYQEIMRIQV